MTVRVLLEDEVVRASIVTLEPGETHTPECIGARRVVTWLDEAQYEHRDYLGIVSPRRRLKGDSATFTSGKGHSLRNTSPKAFRTLVIEFRIGGG